MSTLLYDVIIIGGGPAGLTAALYTGRSKLKTLVIERAFVGGQITRSEKVDNYPGFPEGITGFDLTQQMQIQAEKYGVEITSAEVNAIHKTKDHFEVVTETGGLSGRCIIICGGTERNKLEVPGEEEFSGRGVSYCATCDAPFYNDKVVAVVGGGNMAFYEALHLSEFAKKVYLIHRRQGFRADAVLMDKAKNKSNIELVLDTVVTSINGQDSIQSLSLNNLKTLKTSTLPIDGLFVAVGLQPNTTYLKGVVDMDKNGSILVNDQMETSVSGILSAGDIRSGSIRQVISAAGDGAVAALSAKRYLDL
ncbi:MULTISPECIES: thioredoxin-disulfide reductase [Dehalococcoides]|jgi:thioredoxin reductase (NADPH)|uniref:Thioredoxin reductase n=2 Tax=Dehalococcoides mccartyi TaxID=61435 RepID=A0A142V9I9_9CHLR|nr:MULTISPECIES: thioredoxin-disulfide reductase [Dehalococcoides]AGG06179.1 thioredoxin reductase [Dehalococcoides mccartyi DCMB5]AGG07611.1 thioredoxin reductase [Dehalococcoides mccartyi BTF08]AII60643.1 thioredoxin reductase [Dehalococcoides mccartyi CG5]AMU86309.1 thioredoxin reductase [Dehalococcoides mccartyi]AQU05628.1 thioredoxin-disulfide reductase [Dehalococcoides mccartyi]